MSGPYNPIDDRTKEIKPTEQKTPTPNPIPPVDPNGAHINTKTDKVKKHESK